ncbi:TIGR00266 family protein [Leptospira noguchii]|uniref:TIGR00266 family protein n=2 Tax=Leptospira noguchii TaxID=28182 RepID=A0A9Q8RGP4_9LEPT|nr:TIGR00266 family protein [Leptospira noguchii]EKR72463.1 TIGR00266 family protein [Leptospira noguchii str. 2006001870]EMI72302.1 TIGR00266 family protein [Leptospira noguchii str. Bonito]EMN01718.1 TIGR00266 family protein [Leptospira noguchii str. 2007001578]EMS84285.1 TIGR00266 family protein [Leptospira noguchii str. Cascata]EMS86996.1 TIGR00266 family protein [Leptospira noguchii str. Hook]
MKHEILLKPDFPIIQVQLNDGESIRAESGAMVAMSPTVKMVTKAEGGIFASAKRALLGGESFFQNTFQSEGGTGTLFLTSSTQGDIEYRKMNGEDLILSRGAYVAGSESLSIDSKWGGFKGFFSGEGLFFLKVSGTGDLFFSSFGAIHTIDVNGQYVVDTGHIVGFEGTLDYTIQKVGGLKSLFLSGEGLVAVFSGSGKLYIQSRNQNSFVAWANQWRRVEKSSSSD